MALRFSTFAALCCLACGTGTASGPPDASVAPVNITPVLVTPDAGQVSQAIAGQVELLGSASAQGVTVAIQPGELTTTTDSSGSFLFASVVPGDYTVTASLRGYQPDSASVTVTLGNDASVSLTLERSTQLLAVAPRDLTAPFLAYAPWITANGGSSNGKTPGTALFFGASGDLWELVDGGPVLRSTNTGAQELLGFDPPGNAVVETSGALVDFLDPGTVGQVPLFGVQDPTLSGPNLLCSAATAQGSTWYATAPDFLAPQQLATHIAPAPAPVPMEGGMAGWQSDPCLAVEIFGVGLAIPLTTGCAGALTPLTASVDRDRLAYVDVPDSGAWGVKIVGLWDTTIADGVIETIPTDGGAPAVYPLTEDMYATGYTGIDNVQRLVIDGPDGSSQIPVVGWAPLHGSDLLAATLADTPNGANVLTLVDTGISIPFPYAWVQPLFSRSDRYVVFPGIPSIFDLVSQIEVPLSLTPVSVSFDRSEAHALFADNAGNLVLLTLGSLVTGAAPQGVALEGTAAAQSFTADEQSVAYLGQDPEGNSGLFVQPLPDSE